MSYAKLFYPWLIFMTTLFCSKSLFAQSTIIDKAQIRLSENDVDIDDFIGYNPLEGKLLHIWGGHSIVLRNPSTESPYLPSMSLNLGGFSLANKDQYMIRITPNNNLGDWKTRNSGQISVSGNSSPLFVIDGLLVPAIRLRNTFGFDEWSLGFYWDSAVNPSNFTDDHNKFAFSLSGETKSTIDKNGNYHQVSDEKLKKDIRKINKGLITIMQLRPYSYKFENMSKKIELGFLAQDIEKIIPELARRIKNKEHDEILINYSGIIPILVSAIQEQIRDLDKRNNESKVFNKRVDTLTKKILALKNMSK